AFEVLGAKLVGWRTDNFNFASQLAIEPLRARTGRALHPHPGGRRGTPRAARACSAPRGCGATPDPRHGDVQHDLGRVARGEGRAAGAAGARMIRAVVAALVLAATALPAFAVE